MTYNCLFSIQSKESIKFFLFTLEWFDIQSNFSSVWSVRFDTTTETHHNTKRAVPEKPWKRSVAKVKTDKLQLSSLEVFFYARRFCVRSGLQIPATISRIRDVNSGDVKKEAGFFFRPIFEYTLSIGFRL